MAAKTIRRNGTATLYYTPLGQKQGCITAVITEAGRPAQAAAEAYGQVVKLLAEEDMEVVHERIFGSLADSRDVLEKRREVLQAGGVDWQTPVTYLQGRPLAGRGLAGINLLTVRRDRTEAIWTVPDETGRPCGRAWRRDGATFLLLQNLHGRAEDAAEADQCTQAARMFDRAERILRSQNASYRSVTRTWLYLANILAWYDDFNRVRSTRYDRFGLMPRRESHNGRAILLPASTGIEGQGLNRAAATLDLLATIVEPGSPVEIHQMSNPRQKDAFKYGSAFSRGAAIRLPDATWISISGTAAIDESGASCHIGDFRGQMNMTLDNIETLIAQEGASLSDLCDATVFLKRPEDVETYRRIAAERGLENLPGVPVIADVCRDDLLFEMDGAAVVSK
ncbi:MAG: hypothetical protein J7M21_00960 [Planctomycetes bacterium]|nr:hypothetical protein [Planctomycetota bacterium]